MQAFRALRRVELWGSAATHPVLPLRRAGCSSSWRPGSPRTRRWPFGGGLWLPECAYEPGLERDLAVHGVRAFCVDQTRAIGRGAAR